VTQLYSWYYFFAKNFTFNENKELGYSCIHFILPTELVAVPKVASLQGTKYHQALHLEQLPVFTRGGNTPLKKSC
jgi:hypothetical protein